MLVTLFGIVTDVKLERFWNAALPMLVTLYEILLIVTLLSILIVAGSKFATEPVTLTLFPEIFP
jgi:hypothetical protein